MATTSLMKGIVRKAKRVAIRAKKRIPRPVRNTGNRVFEGLHYAYANAGASIEANEAIRGNKIGCLNTKTPWVPIPAATPQGPGTTSLCSVMIKEGRYIRSFHATAADELSFMCASFRVNGFDVVDGDPINLSVLMSTLSHIDRYAPLTGRKWTSAIQIDGVFLNITGGPAIFHGIDILMTDTECTPAAKRSRPAPGFHSFRRIFRKLRAVVRLPRRRR